MARSIEEIKEQMTTAFMADTAAQTAYGFGEGERFTDHFSPVSIENILFYVFAVCAYTLERLTETHLGQVRQIVSELRPHTLAWYQAKALKFRWGEAINDDTADYDTEATSNTIFPVSQCAVTEDGEGGLIFKLASANEDGDLEALRTDCLTAFTSYINRIKDAGIRTTIISRAGDRLTLNLTVYVDGTVFTADGELISEPTRPVETAIKEYLTRLPFNGELVLEHLTDYLQTIEGVEVPHINSARSAALSSTSYGYAASTPIDVRTTPVSGYFLVSFESADDWHSTINYRFRP